MGAMLCPRRPERGRGRGRGAGRVLAAFALGLVASGGPIASAQTVEPAPFGQRAIGPDTTPGSAAPPPALPPPAGGSADQAPAPLPEAPPPAPDAYAMTAVPAAPPPEPF